MIHEPHSRLDLAISRDDFFLHSFPFGYQICGLRTCGLPKVFFNTIQVARAKKNLGQVIDNRLLDLFGAKTLHIAFGGFAENRIVTVVAMRSVFSMRGLADQRSATVRATKNAGK